MTPFTLYKSREFSAAHPVEIVSTIKPTRGGPYRYTPVIHLPIGELKAGDVLDIPACYVQVSSKMTYNLMVASILILTEVDTRSASFTMDAYTPYVELTEGVGQNITNNVHHYPVMRSARHVVQQDMQNAILIFIVYTASTAWDGTSLLSVDSDYGRLEGAVHRPVTPEELAEFLTGVPAPAPPAPAPEPPPPAPAPEPELITLQITPAQALTLQEVAALIPQE